MSTSRLLLFSCFAGFLLDAGAQNLVPNWSFEEHTQCPDDYGQVNRCADWHKSLVNNVPQYHTEYLNSCGTSTFSVPSNTWGTQPASTGSAYMAMVTMAPFVQQDYRENIYAQLISPLVVGDSYDVHLMVSWTDNSEYATNNIGVKFSTDTNFPIDGVSQVYSSAIINDTQNWVEISGSFTAEEAYDYICVGNFFTDSETSYSNDCPNCSFYQYGYYVDDICVVPKHGGNGDCMVSYTPEAIYEVNGAAVGMHVLQTGTGYNVLFSRPLPQKAALTVYDMQGRSLGTATIATGTTTQSLNMDGIAPGAYMLSVNVDGERWTQRFVKVQ